MADLMKAGVITAPYEFEIREIPIPEPGPGEVLIRQKAVALCTMEQRVYTGVKKFPYPGCWGHEVAGVVEKVGPENKTQLKEGDHVVLGVPYFCGECEYCTRGLEEHCLADFGLPKMEGIIGLFGMAQYMVVESKRAIKVASEIPFAEKALAEPLGCVLQGIKKLNILERDTVVVVGAGTMGLLNVMAAKRRGARVVVSEIDPKRREKAEKLGADASFDPSKEDAEEAIQRLNDGRKADAVILAIGNENANKDAMKMTAKEGRILYFASAHPSVPFEVDPNFIHDTGIVLTGVKGKNLRDVWDAAAMLSSGTVKTDELIEEVYPLDKAQKALEKASNNNTFRIVLEM